MQEKKRYYLLDVIRGITIISMILYHASWDIEYIFGQDLAVMGANSGYIWQQATCWSFILLSGFCWSMGKNPLKRGIVIFLWGAALTVATLIAMPQNRVLFGVLTFLGVASILMVALNPLLKRMPRVLGLCGSAFLFVILRNINSASLGFGDWRFFTLPSWLYQGDISAFFGFPGQGFHSTDYFSVFPWFFLFCVGYFFYHIATHRAEEFSKFWDILSFDIKPLSFLGKHSLLIYILHQPIIFCVLYLWYNFSILL